jgi:hypothetical protein
MPYLRFFSVPEAAVELGMGESTLRRLCVAGEVKGAVKLGRDWIVPSTALNRLTPRKAGRPSKR